MHKFSKWVCPICGATHNRNGKPFNRNGLGRFGHMRLHQAEGILARAEAPGGYVLADAQRFQHSYPEQFQQYRGEL